MKVKIRPVNADPLASLQAFWHCLSFATVLLQALVVINCNYCKRLIASFSAPLGGVAVLFNLNQCRSPSLFNPDLLLCTEFDLKYVFLFLYLIFQKMIGPSNVRWFWFYHNLSKSIKFQFYIFLIIINHQSAFITVQSYKALKPF